MWEPVSHYVRAKCRCCDGFSLVGSITTLSLLSFGGDFWNIISREKQAVEMLSCVSIYDV